MFYIYYCFHIFVFVNTCAVWYGTACRKCFKIHQWVFRTGP